MSDVVLSVKNLTKQFGTFTAVDGISFDVVKGEIVGLLGPNGAGKTTTIQMLLSLLKPTGGEINYFDKSLVTHRQEILQRINHTSGYSRLPWRMSVWENLDVYGHLYSVKDHRTKIEKLLETFELVGERNKPFQDLSAGQKTRAALIKAFLNDPEIVLLDEPTTSLDPDIAEKIREFILNERTKRSLSILITSHNMQEVEEMCDRVVFLHHGRIYAIDTPQGLAKRNTESQLELMVRDGLKRLIELTQKHNYSFKEKKRFITITLPEKEIAQFLTSIGKKGIEYSEIEIVRPSLEDFFLSVSEEVRA